ncbi:MAG TPA: orotidine-5'-phosphate decarboxylase [Oculatellaceae cyanobacterium]
MPISSNNDVAKRLFVALDVPDADSALKLAEQLAPAGVSFKVGMQLFYAAGMRIVKELQTDGRTVFVDLKLHDIPNTVAGAMKSLLRQGVQFVNVHTQGGPDMMRAAAEAARQVSEETGTPRPIVIGVTLLTSLSQAHLNQFLGVNQDVKTYVQHLARQAKDCGLDGIVCSAQEASFIRSACGPDFLLVTPGIRPTQDAAGDQSRVITPRQAIQNGADYLVVGRPVIGASNPADAARRIIDEMAEALKA